MDSQTCQERQPSDQPSSSSNCSSSKSHCERERIRNQMKMVIGQLEGILQELKEVAKELREVVSQIDRLTSDFEFELEPDDWTTATASSSSSSEKGGGTFELGPLDFTTSDILSDSWEFCSFLDASTPSDPGDGAEPPRPHPQPPPPRQPDYRLMNGGIPIANGPREGGTPDSSSEEAFGPPTSQKVPSARPPGTRERVRFSDKVLYHALCCDDDREGDNEAVSPGEGGPEETGRKVAAGPPPRRAGGSGGTGAPGRRLTRNSSTQTVADKSTQTVLPYVPPRQRIHNKN
ncbi:LOW QUALITY PROTEIN: inhibitory synaptic factor 1 [Calypte anna]|uniref:LOW QUALITY PROTEIN: inhibitory synaptic factor 1 n=1 Tax=Calypte anna TaxID=9244 RepID=UPI0011C47619|nr:LOW QUALITY PROTEIN: inhibitory synaptic factor 1 [Calypte anna]